MKYIAYKGTYNEQIYDSEKKEVRFKNSKQIIKNVVVTLKKVWKEK